MTTKTNTPLFIRKKQHPHQTQIEFENKTIFLNLIAETKTISNCNSDETSLLVSYQEEIKTNVRDFMKRFSFFKLNFY